MDTTPTPEQQRIAALLKTVKFMEEGYGGMTKEGRLVDRREHPEATKIAANPFLKIGKPKHV